MVTGFACKLLGSTIRSRVFVASVWRAGGSRIHGWWRRQRRARCFDNGVDNDVDDGVDIILGLACACLFVVALSIQACTDALHRWLVALRRSNAKAMLIRSWKVMLGSHALCDGSAQQACARGADARQD